MDEHDRLAERFEQHRARLRAVAHRMLGSLTEAEDAVQETWLRLDRAGAGGIENPAAWLTTVVSRICLDMLRARAARREEPADAVPLPDGSEPEQEVLLMDSVGRALLVVLDRLGPAERVAFVLHDLFAVPFEEIAPIVGRSPVTTKKLASRARHKVHGDPVVPEADLARQRDVVDAFLAAARGGDLDGLLAVLAPGVVRRADPAALPPGVPAEVRGARAVIRETAVLGRRARHAQTALVNGAVGVVVAPRGRLVLVLVPTVEDGRIAAYEVIAAPARLAALDLALLDPAPAAFST
ncbi:sigma-70 family RNA polymerase sigma factor [Streptomyces sp. AV19]|uniref:sigma-70 family RNA polymerase sigma factor n=1 Tax=Streptomyces sp. AV19 TaxID=2793068 RepID=UPI0018FE7CBD|nr:sigma-70 family RNA polymerase sigma factor [Streptomyces sp. AV19]MBH1938490.1 sigma-70 family RNA polymerase sigma factor [Streptomyces sp. AV19]MDG4535139.1 sigma-70 family RNA polymerase sigma factor [Streptomyces sp. AV19]